MLSCEPLFSNINLATIYVDNFFILKVINNIVWIKESLLSRLLSVFIRFQRFPQFKSSPTFFIHIFEVENLILQN